MNKNGPIHLKNIFDEEELNAKVVVSKMEITTQHGGISAYWARHTFATLLAELDTPIDTISLALGHSYGSKVTQVYINPDLRKAD